MSKFDQFTRRKEDSLRKLLWTFGTDPEFEGPKGSKTNITVNPSNFPKVRGTPPRSISPDLA